MALSDEKIYECERIASIRHRKHTNSIRGQQLTSADDPQWHFALAIEAMTNGTACVAWPPVPAPDQPTLPASLRLTLSLDGQEPFRTEVLIQTAAGIQSPIDRKDQKAEEPAAEPAAAAAAEK